MKIIIEVRGGLVSAVAVDNKDVQLMIVDYDAEGADPDEMLSNEDIRQFVGNSDMMYIEPDQSGVRDQDWEEAFKGDGESDEIRKSF